MPLVFGKEGVPRGFAYDRPTVEFLKVNPPFIPDSAAPLYVEDQSVPLALAPEIPLITPTRDFQGISYTGWIPPDNGTAAGKHHIVEMVNSSWRVFDMSGSTATSLTPFCGDGGWWSPVLPGGVTLCFDPRVLYDQFSDRWVMVAVARDNSTEESWYLLSTSWTSDPTGTWCTWALDATVDGGNATSNWADFPGLGVDGLAIYITSNQFAFGGGFQYSKLRILEKKQLYANACGAVHWWDYWSLENADSSKAFTLQPAHTYGTPGVEYLLNSRSGSGNNLTLWSLTNPVGGPPTLMRSTVPVAAYSLPPDASQCETATLVNTGDARLQNAVYRNGRLWTTHTVAAGEDSRVRYLQIDPGGPTVLDDFTFGATGFFYYYPAVMSDAAGNIYTVFNRSSASECVGVRYTGRASSEPNNTLQGSSQLQPGNSSYVRLDSSDRNRWGDYSGIAADPVLANAVWIAGEYVSSTDFWATWIARLDTGALLFQDDMESGTGSWLAQSGWSLTTEQANSPTHAWSDSPGGNYDNAASSLLWSPVFDLSNLTSATLTFWHRYQLETSFDFGRVMVTTDGAVLTQVRSFTGTNTSWTQETIPLAAYLGEPTVQIVFHLTSDTSITADGWYIDDVAVTGIPNSAPIPEIYLLLGPATIPSGSPGINLTVTGHNFIPQSIVQWNGQSRTTNYFGENRLVAFIPASDLVGSGTAIVTVVNPPPGGGTSNAMPFTYDMTE